LTGIRTAGSLL